MKKKDRLRRQKALDDKKKERLRDKGWYTQKGCFCETEPQKSYWCLQRNGCHWFKINEKYGCADGTPRRSWWPPSYPYDYLDNFVPLDEKQREDDFVRENEELIEKGDFLGDIFAQPYDDDPVQYKQEYTEAELLEELEQIEREEKASKLLEERFREL